MQYIENRTFDELEPGASAELTRTMPARAGALAADGAGPGSADSPVDNLWVAELLAAIISLELPGPGTRLVDQSLHVERFPTPGEAVTMRVTVRARDAAARRVQLDCECRGADGERLADGSATVVAPSKKTRAPRGATVAATLHVPGERHDALIEATRRHPPLATAVVHPCDEAALRGAIEAMADDLILPVLVGPQARIRATATRAGLSLDGIELVDVPHSHAAAATAVALARSGKVGALMKGALHTDELMAAVVDAQSGLRTERRISHVFALDVPTYPKPLLITDAAINIYPTLADKRDIVQNAIDLAHALGIELPKVAILSAVETVNPKITSTVEAAALCKMLDRGQITGAVLDGPLAFDNAISPSAAASKQLNSPVAGNADILVVPDLESGNMLAKQLVYLAGADVAGIALGARVPIVLTSRSDSVRARVASCALAKLYAHFHADARR